MSEKPYSTAVLSYGLAKPRVWRRVGRRFVALCVLVIVVGFVGQKIARVVRLRLELLHCQDQVLNGSPTPEPPLVARASYPGERLSFQCRDENWFHFCRGYQPTAIGGLSTVYVHSIFDRHGNELIVAIEITTRVTDRTPMLTATVLKPGNPFRDPSPASVAVHPFAFDFNLKNIPLYQFIIYSGQPDENDRSHFTIKYELNDELYALDGYINEQDSLTIEKRKDPITQPLPSSPGQSQ